MEVSATFDEFIIKLRFLILESLNVACAKTVDCKSFVNKELENCRT